MGGCGEGEEFSDGGIGGGGGSLLIHLSPVKIKGGLLKVTSEGRVGSIFLLSWGGGGLN